MSEAPGTLEGWYALHDFRTFDWGKWRTLSQHQRRDIIEELTAFGEAAERAADAPEGSSAFFTIIGHKANFMMLHLRPQVDQLEALERAFARTRFAELTTRPYSYLSVTELSLYEATARGASGDPAEVMKNPFVQRRLKPQIPTDKRYVCFYPMNKRRGEHVNWYAAPLEERRRMMAEHGSTGRKYQGEIVQMITGSTGLDDWEWGVTLFGVDPLPVKKLVYEMRFDEVSARYAEFGSFYFGRRVTPAEWAALLGN